MKIKIKQFNGLRHLRIFIGEGNGGGYGILEIVQSGVFRYRGVPDFLTLQVTPGDYQIREEKW